MIRCESSQLQPEISLHGSADVRRSAGVDAPAPILVLVVQNAARRLVKALLIAGAEQGMKQDVIGFEAGIGFQFAAPVTILVLLGEKIIAGRIDSDCNPASQVVNLSKSHQ